MKLAHVWLVIDPESISTGLRDIMYRQKVSGLHLQILGSGPHWWSVAHVALHTDKTSALADARARVQSKFGKPHADKMFSPANIRKSFQ